MPLLFIAIWLAATALGLGGVLLVGWAIFGDASHGRRRCPKCWHSMAGITSLTCPECGHAALAEPKLFKSRRRWRWILPACALLTLAYATALVPKAIRLGWSAVVPNTVLIYGWRYDTSTRLTISQTSLLVQHNQLWPWQRRALVRQCAREFRDTSSGVRDESLAMLQRLSPESALAIPDLVLVAQMATDPRQWGAVNALCQMPASSDAVIPALATLAESGDSMTTRTAVANMITRGPEGVAWLRSLSANPNLRDTIAEAIVHSPATNDRTVQRPLGQLVASMPCYDPQIEWSVQNYLADLGATGLELSRPLLASNVPELRIRGIESIRHNHMQDLKDIEAIESLAADPDASVRRSAEAAAQRMRVINHLPRKRTDIQENH